MPTLQTKTTLIGLLLLILIVIGCQPAARQADGVRPPPLLLISIDGMRHDYFDLTDTPALDRLVAEGLVADSLKHVFPTKTFPTHYSIVTGRHPGTHGIVANSMWDRNQNRRFSLGNREEVGDGFWYRDGEPIWVTAKEQGLIAATYFWPGSEARIHRIRPDYWMPYSAQTPHAERVDQVLAWMDLPEAQRPDLYTLYFSSVDSLGHRHGPRAEPVAAALAEVDQQLGRLLAGLEQRGLLGNMHILIVSDHGMSRVDLDQYIMLDDYLDLGRVRVSDWGPAAQIWAIDLSVDEIISALDGVHPNLRVWRREDIPARYHFGPHHRVPDVLAEADLEWMISNKPYMAGRTRFSLLGMHGWDPAWLEMHGVFVAHGPQFAAGSKAPAVRSIDLYALMTHLLNLEAADHEGSLEPLQMYLDKSHPVIPERHEFVCQPDNQALQAVIGPAHMALHWAEQVHVLDRISERHYRDTGVEFQLEDNGARASIENHEFHDCRLLTTRQETTPGPSPDR